MEWIWGPPPPPPALSYLGRLDGGGGVPCIWGLVCYGWLFYAGELSPLSALQAVPWHRGTVPGQCREAVARAQEGTTPLHHLSHAPHTPIEKPWGAESTFPGQFFPTCAPLPATGEQATNEVESWQLSGAASRGTDRVPTCKAFPVSGPGRFMAAQNNGARNWGRGEQKAAHEAGGIKGNAPMQGR